MTQTQNQTAESGMFRRPKSTQADFDRANQKVLPIPNTVMVKHEVCAICQKPFDNPVMTPGHAKVTHWQCTFDYIHKKS